jgi:L-lactate dehydrogenase complex protein LldE
MKVGLFIPCYIDQCYPEVGRATLELLEGLGVEVGYPLGQTCCGQPLANSGFEADTQRVCKRFVEQFHAFDYVVSPSGSCVYHIREHYDHLTQTDAVSRVRTHTYELCDFLVSVLKVTDLGSHFPYKVGLHKSCHGLRGLNLGTSSELTAHPTSVMQQLLEKVEGLELETLTRDDECCGFGGTFAVMEEAVSVKMGKDRIADHLEQGVEFITASDSSCLMHLEGLIKRKGYPIKTLHIAEILNTKKPVTA